MFLVSWRRSPPKPEYEVYVPPVLCEPDLIDFMSGYWRCSFCAEECPMTCPVQDES